MHMYVYVAYLLRCYFIYLLPPQLLLQFINCSGCCVCQRWRRRLALVVVAAVVFVVVVIM